ncbi:MAG: hypothetical protein HY589_02395 [Candidatus Omnitrophica bacterium]|nr:hypothetical protein [Candidatus Omnitrophota bacterium]
MDFAKVKTYSIKGRKSKVNIAEFAKISRKGAGFADFYEGLPDILAVRNLKALVNDIIYAYKHKRMVIFMLGAHVIKCGLSPLVIDLMRRGVVKAVALNGAGIIHDTEIAMVGKTSEDVGAGILDGSFGMAKETAEFINEGINDSCRSGIGIGEAIGKKILDEKLKNKNLSILAAAHKLSVPLTVHVAIGADIVHQHPLADGAAIGEGTMADFKKLVDSVARLGGGGVVVNFGSAVILPEVFLKAINLARNLGARVKGFTAANFDMHTHYRPTQNILLRPTRDGFGKGYNFVGHHEIMLPLLYQAIIERV